MQAIRFHRYGAPEVLRLEEVPVPAVGADEVLVRVRAAAINPYDWHMVTGLPLVMRLKFGVRGPGQEGVGGDLAGTVEAVGASVERFAPGDAVFGTVGGGVDDHPFLELGSLAEFVAVDQAWLQPIPATLDFEQAAAVPLAGVTALQGLRDVGHVEAGHAVLVNGASGGVGTFAVQIAKAFGAEVTGVCSTRNVELVRSLGADHVVDYTRDDFMRTDRRYDVVLDNVGNRSLRDHVRILRDHGIYIASYGQPEHRWVGPLAKLARMQLLDRFVTPTLTSLDQVRDPDDLAVLAAMIDAGQVIPVVDRTYRLTEAPDAFRYLEQGHARAKVVVTT